MSTAHWHWATHWAWNWRISSGSAGITIWSGGEGQVRIGIPTGGLVKRQIMIACQRQHTSSVSNMVRLEEKGELVLSLSSQWLSKKAAPKSLTRLRFTPDRPAAAPWASPPRTRTDTLCAGCRRVNISVTIWQVLTAGYWNTGRHLGKAMITTNLGRDSWLLFTLIQGKEPPSQPSYEPGDLHFKHLFKPQLHRITFYIYIFNHKLYISPPTMHVPHKIEHDWKLLLDLGSSFLDAPVDHIWRYVFHAAFTANSPVSHIT